MSATPKVARVVLQTSQAETTHSPADVLDRVRTPQPLLVKNPARGESDRRVVEESTVRGASPR